MPLNKKFSSIKVFSKVIFLSFKTFLCCFHFHQCSSYRPFAKIIDCNGPILMAKNGKFPMSWQYLSCFCKKIAAVIRVLASNMNWLKGLATILATRWTSLISSTTWSRTTWLFGSTWWIHEWVLYSRLTSSTTWVGTSHLGDWTGAWLTGYCWRTGSGRAWKWKCLWFYFRISARLLERST